MSAKDGKVFPEVFTQDDGRLIVVDPRSVQTADENVRKMGEMILQLGTMIGAMQKRLDEMEARQEAVTISHGDVKRIQALIRCRADEICRKYGLSDRESPKIFRAAMKKDVLRRCQVKDLHDVPERMRSAVDRQIDSWTDIRLVMERRGSA